jgi:hypothetical protein
MFQKEIARREFKSCLSKLRLILQESLDNTNVLDSNSLDKMLEKFSTKLEVTQHEFLLRLASLSEESSSTRRFRLNASGGDWMPETGTAIAAGAGAAVLANLVTFSSTTLFFWTTTSSAAAVAATAIGVSTGIATAGVGLIVGGVAWWGVNTLLEPGRRKSVYDTILHKFDTEIRPQLTAWADERIDACFQGTNNVALRD